jgi:hypothetical protein
MVTSEMDGTETGESRETVCLISDTSEHISMAFGIWFCTALGGRTVTFPDPEQGTWADTKQHVICSVRVHCEAQNNAPVTDIQAGRMKLYDIKFQVLTAANMKIRAIWDIG